MRIKRAGPDEGPRKDHDHFRYVETGFGKRWEAYVAGPCYWCIAHTSERTKPCLKWFTDGELHCPKCKNPEPPKMTGYLPLYRQVDGCPVLIVVYEQERQYIDKFTLHQRIIVGKEGEQGSSNWVRGALSAEPKWQTTSPWRQHEQEVFHTCLAMWKLPELEAWLHRPAKRSDNAVSLPDGVAVDDAGKPFAPETQAAAKRAGASVVNTPEAKDALDEAMRKLKERAGVLKPSKNGTGKHE